MEELVDAGFWQGRRVFMTGHTGFKGSWLCLWLQRLGAAVTGYALAAQHPSIFADADVAAGMRSIEGDVRDFEHLRSAILDAQPEIIFHLAAQALVRQSYRDPIETYSTNVLGTVHLLEAVRAAECVRAVVNVTSDKCYHNREWTWGYRETDRLGGRDPYSSSKAAAELVTESFRQSFFQSGRGGAPPVALASVRAGNVVGGGDWAVDRLIPDVVRAILEGRPVQIRNPQAVRPWQHVLDPLAGYLVLAQRLSLDGPPFACAWNFGPGHQNVRPVSWVVERLLSRWGGSLDWKLDSQPNVHEARYLMLDSTKAMSELGWCCRWDLERSIDAVVEWYKARQDRRDMRQVTISQIRAYCGSAAAV